MRFAASDVVRMVNGNSNTSNPGPTVGRSVEEHALRDTIESASMPLPARDGRNRRSVYEEEAGRKDTDQPRILEITEREVWNDLVLGLPNSELQQGFEWGELKREEGWLPHRFGVFHARRCVGAIQVFVLRLPRSNYLALYAPRGPLLDWEDDEAWKGLMHCLRRLAAQTSAVVLRVSPAAPADDPRPREALLSRGFVQLSDNFTTWNMPRIIQTLDLGPTEAELKRQMRGRARDLRVALRRGTTIEASSSTEAVRRLHHLMVRLEEERGYSGPSLGWLMGEQREYYSAGQGLAFIISHGGKDLAGATAVRFGDRAYALHLALNRSLEVGFRAGTALVWEQVRWAKAQGCKVLNLGGSIRRLPPDPGDVGYGVYQYKRSFGASLNYLSGYYDLVLRPTIYRFFRVVEKVRPLWWRLQSHLNAPRPAEHEQASCSDRASRPGRESRT